MALKSAHYANKLCDATEKRHRRENRVISWGLLFSVILAAVVMYFLK